MAVMKASMKTMKAMKVSKGSMKKLSRGQKTSKADREFKNEVTKLREENAALRQLVTTCITQVENFKNEVTKLREEAEEREAEGSS